MPPVPDVAFDSGADLCAAGMGGGHSGPGDSVWVTLLRSAKVWRGVLRSDVEKLPVAGCLLSWVTSTLTPAFLWLKLSSSLFPVPAVIWAYCCAWRCPLGCGGLAGLPVPVWAACEASPLACSMDTCDQVGGRLSDLFSAPVAESSPPRASDY